MKTSWLRPFILIIIVFVAMAWSKLSCKDENNKNVDWFIAIKYPKKFDFVYQTSDKPSQWNQAVTNLSSAKSMLGLTIQQSYSNSVFYAYYNNQKPKKDYNAKERGNLKGVLNLDTESGYWLIHSVPGFPFPNTYLFSINQTKFAQTFICVTVDFSTLGPIILQLLMMDPTVYSYNIPNNFVKNATLLSNLDAFVKNKKVSTKISNSLAFQTIGRFPFIHFGKSGDFNDDLYDALIAPKLEAPLYVESWIRGKRINSSCTLKYKVFDVKEVKLVNTNFKSSDDNCKWAVTTMKEKPYVCIGDINRMTTQFKRGGGSLCMSDVKIWNSFYSLVQDHEKC